MSPNSSKYNQRGVSSQKEDVHAAVKNLDKGLFPNAFCKIFPDYFLNDSTYCSIVHADGAGSKSALAYLYWKETGDAFVWRGIAQDSIVMNTDDLLCTGATGPFLFSSIINRNKNLIPGEVLREIIEGSQAFINSMKQYDVEIIFMGGETADLGDIVKTITVDSTISCRLKREDVIENNIQSNDVIVGLASFGKASYEAEYNSGIGSNGLTMARHEVLHHSYSKKYPETFDNKTDESLVYSGTKKITDPVEGTPFNAGKLLLSPTRTYAPLMKIILKNFHKKIHGLIHCSGGGQTKVLHFAGNIHVVKDNLFAAPPVFGMIQQEGKTDWKEMYEVFNMGHRLEIYTDETTADEIIQLARSFNIESKIIGHCEASPKRKLTIQSEFGTFIY